MSLYIECGNSINGTDVPVGGGGYNINNTA